MTDARDEAREIEAARKLLDLYANSHSGDHHRCSTCQLGLALADSLDREQRLREENEAAEALTVLQESLHPHRNTDRSECELCMMFDMLRRTLSWSRPARRRVPRSR